MRWLIITSLFSFLFADINSTIINFYKHYYPKIHIKQIVSNKPFPNKYKKVDLSMLNPKLSNGLIKIDNSYYSIKIDASILAYVADKTIKINEFIEPNVSLKEIKFRVFYSPLVYNVKNLVAKQIISKNGVITKNNTKKAPDVFKNQSVQVIIKSPNIDIITSAVALNDGNVGEFIKIKLNNKILNAQIIKPGVVTIK